MAEATATTSGPSEPAGTAPVGREDECGTLDRLLGSVPDRGAALLLSGDPGIGKTTLLDYAATLRRDLRILRSRAVESEAVLAYSLLAELLLPLRPYFTELPSSQRGALEGCLALADLADPHPYAVCAGALGVLAAAGEDQPLLVLVDDLQWADPSSRQVLQFVARRMEAERVALVMTVRCGREPGSGWEGIPQLTLAALTEESSRALLLARGLEHTDPALDRIVELGAGNPLVLVEYADAVCRARADGASPAHEGWERPGALVERAWWERIGRLPRPTREALVYVAACRSARFALLERALKSGGLSLTDLDAAEEAGLVAADHEAYQLRHSILRPLVLTRSPAAQRLRAHRALAEAGTGELRTWHLAAAASEPSEEVAAALADIAEGAERRGALGDASRAWHRAAELSPDAGERAARLLRAARGAFTSGATRDAAVWCEQALRCSTDPRLTADIELLRGQVCGWRGDPGRAHRLLIAAADAAEHVDRRRAAVLCGTAAVPAVMNGCLALGVAAADRCTALTGPQDPWDQRQLADVMQGSLFALAGRVEEGRELLLRSRDALHGGWALEERQCGVQIGQALSWVEEDDAARDVLGAVVEESRRAGTPVLLPYALVGRSAVEWWSHWAAARADATEGLRWAQELGHVMVAGYALTLLAQLAAVRGDQEGCEEHVARYERTCGGKVRGLEMSAAAALGSAALAVGDVTVGRAELERALTLGEEMELTNPELMPFLADLAEARVRTGDRDAAQLLGAWLERSARTTGLAWPAAAHARCRAVLAESPDEAHAWLAEGEQAHARRAMPFELARIRLAGGAALRRLRRPAEARDPLLSAHREFVLLGASSWVVAAATELAAAGHRFVPCGGPEQPAVELLTAQELQVARAIGEGLSNAEAATTLFLSRKTVEAYLTRIYRKLGVRSRSDLARCLVRAGVVR
ncbi:AAA family ATPase [Streptomyces sp. Tu102]|uniref:AAA family ATPase n=1 Tax=Streptomyces sp. Tu102 TaxID=2838019 RepID=UPI001BDC9A1A|nr:AAA family ATPase [Streptomyces sp. Tu102]MBT1090307.1 AAA family ATPase [Streptomyces sp. Tu102]